MYVFVKELEEAYCGMLAKEECRITEQHMELLQLRKELQALEEELAFNFRNKMMKQDIQQREATLNHFLKDIEHKVIYQFLLVIVAMFQINEKRYYF